MDNSYIRLVPPGDDNETVGKAAQRLLLSTIRGIGEQAAVRCMQEMAAAYSEKPRRVTWWLRWWPVHGWMKRVEQRRCEFRKECHWRSAVLFAKCSEMSIEAIVVMRENAAILIHGCVGR